MTPSDFLGCRRRLSDALQTAAETNPPNAYEIAAALGFCRLWDIELEEDLDGDLPPEIAIAAAEHLVVQAARLKEQTESLPEQWDTAETDLEWDQWSGGILTARMEIWAAWVAIDQAYEACLENQDEQTETLEQALDANGESLDKLDEAMRGQADLLSWITHEFLLENWRRMLAESFCLPFPWWLDGTLEQAAKEQQTDADLVFPDRETLERLERIVWERETPRPIRLSDMFIYSADVLPEADRSLAAAVEKGKPRHLHWRWRHPDNNGDTAELYLQIWPPLAPDDEFVLRFRDSRGTPTKSYLGREVYLAGQLGESDATGKFVFKGYGDFVAAAKAAGGVLLQVEVSGGVGEYWPKQEEPA